MQILPLLFAGQIQAIPRGPKIREGGDRKERGEGGQRTEKEGKGKGEEGKKEGKRGEGEIEVWERSDMNWGQGEKEYRKREPFI